MSRAQQLFKQKMHPLQVHLGKEVYVELRYSYKTTDGRSSYYVVGAAHFDAGQYRLAPVKATDYKSSTGDRPTSGSAVLCWIVNAEDVISVTPMDAMNPAALYGKFLK